MVEEGRKSMVGSSLGESTAVTNSGLKLKINLRDRQQLRNKRRRSVSPDTACSSDSSTTTKEYPVPTAVITSPPSLKKSHKDQRHRNGSSASTADSEALLSKQSSADEILLVDMNGTSNGGGREGAIEDESNSSSSTSSLSLKENSIIKKKTYEKSLTWSCATLDKSIRLDATNIKRISREDLERLFLEKMCVALRESGCTGTLERQLEATEAQLDRFRRKTEQLHKQVNDLTAVIRRFVSQSKGRKEGVIPPVKVTRAVGLQVGVGMTTLNNSTSAILTSPQKLPPTTQSTFPLAPPPLTPAPPRTSPPPLSSHVKAVGTVSNSPAKRLAMAQVARAPIRPSVTVVPSVTSAALPQQAQLPVNNSVNMISSRIPLPPSFTMQSPDIASYVPQQAMPRYRPSSKRLAESPPSISSLTSTPSMIMVATSTSVDTPVRSRLHSVTKPSVTPPLKQLTPLQSSHQQRSYLATSTAHLTSEINGVTPKNGDSTPTSVIRSSVVTPVRTSPSATTVNKVVLPNLTHRVIDLTDDEQEKETTSTSTKTSSTTPVSTLGTRVPSTGYHVLSKVVVPTTCGPKSTASTSFTSGSQGRSTGPASGSSITVANPHQLAAKPSLHPAKLPGTPLGPVNPAWKSLPPRPTLSISRVANGIVLSWTMQAGATPLAEIASYQLFAYQESNVQPSPSLWKKVGDVKALPLPMACTLTQFLEGHRYHFAVRAMDVHSRAGPYSEPNSIVLS